MKELYPGIGLAKLCGWFGITRQAHYQNSWRAIEHSVEEYLVLKEVLRIRRNHPKIGTRKLQVLLAPYFLAHQIKMGRDALFNLLSAHGLLIKRRTRKVSTTNSRHHLRRYSNLVQDYVPTTANQIWVSDITYWKLGGHYVYISFITDAFSHKIVGYQLADNLEAIETIKALKMALKSIDKVVGAKLIHHSDRGIQYCFYRYTSLLKAYNITISMSNDGDPLENALAERVNGIIKNEYLNHWQINTLAEAKSALEKAVNFYNEERPHLSIGMLTPGFVHSNANKTQRLWKNYYSKNTTIVKPDQDYHHGVNNSQDFNV